jgi:hypothetical protein
MNGNMYIFNPIHFIFNYFIIFLMDDNINNLTSNLKEEEILNYNLEEQLENLNVDYRNSNYKLIKIFFKDLNENIYIKQDYRYGKGGILWDGVKIIYIIQ